MVSANSSEYLAEDNSPTIVATASLMIIFCTLFVGLRYYARYLTSTPFGVEDVIIPFAWLAEMGLCIVAIVMVEKAETGRHMSYILSTDPAKITEHFKGIMIHEVLHPAAVAFPKLCVVVLYLRVFTNKWERRASWALICLIFATWFSFTLASMFQCTPFAYNWDKRIPGGKCFDVLAFSNSSSVPNIVTDVGVLLLPIRTVFELKISIGRKVGLLVIFLTGSVGIIASIIRTVVFVNTDPLKDITYTHAALVNWTMLEPGMYLLAACALSYKPLFRMVAKFLHLDALITHTKSLANSNNKPTLSTKPVTDSGRTFRQSMRRSMKMESIVEVAKPWSERSWFDGSIDDDEESTGEERPVYWNAGGRKMEVIVTKTVELESEVYSAEAKARDEARMKAEKNIM